MATSALTTRGPATRVGPLAAVCAAPLTAETIVEFVRPHVARWAVPDGVVFLDSIPRTTVGKFDKKALRERFRAWSPS